MVPHSRAMFAVLLSVSWAGSSPTQGDEKKKQADSQAAKADKEFLSQLTQFAGLEEQAAAKATPEFFGAARQFLRNTKKDAAQFRLAIVTAEYLDGKGQDEAALKLLAELTTHYADADKKLAQDAAKAYEVAKQRATWAGKPLKLEGTLVGGAKFDWEKYKGKVVLIDFWATWCEPCKADLPMLKEVYAEYRDKGFEIVGISLDKDVDALARFIKAEKLPWENLQSGSGLAEKFGVEGIPFQVIVHRDGTAAPIKRRGEAWWVQVEKLVDNAPGKVTRINEFAGVSSRTYGFYGMVLLEIDGKPAACFGLHKPPGGKTRYTYLILLKPDPKGRPGWGIEGEQKDPVIESDGRVACDLKMKARVGERALEVEYHLRADAERVTSETLKVGGKESGKDGPRVFLVDLADDKPTYIPVNIVPEIVPEFTGDNKEWKPWGRQILQAVKELKEKAPKAKEFFDTESR